MPRPSITTRDKSAHHPAAKHRGSRAPLSLGRLLRRHLAVAAVAATATAGVVATGVAAAGVQGDSSVQAMISDAAANAAGDTAVLGRLESQRDRSTSRSDARTGVDQAKVDLLSQESKSGGQVTKTEDLGSGDPKAIAAAMLSDFGFGSDQMSCLDSLWTKESGWNVHAANPSSSAYGIPQALPGSKMASAGSDWADNPATQIRWGLGYIADTYGSPCAAWGHSESNGWY